MNFAAAASFLRLSGHSVRILAAATSLTAVCMLIRMQMLFYGFGSTAENLRIVRTGFYNSYADVLVIWSIAACCVFLAESVSERHKSWPAKTFVVLAFASVLFACVNSSAVRFLGGSLTYQWLYYADLFRSFTSRSAISPALNVQALSVLIAAVLAFTVLTKAFFKILNAINTQGALSLCLVPGLVAIGAFVYFAERRTEKTLDARGEISNPWIELVTSALAAPSGDLLSMTGLPAYADLPPPSYDRSLLPPEVMDRSIRNVLIFVLESVGARYVATSETRNTEIWTPHIASYAASTYTFTNFYSHVPMSTKSLFSLLTSNYPRFTYEVETTAPTDAKSHYLGRAFKRAGMKTAFFMSGDMEFQYVDSFLKQQSFDRLSDMRDIPCSIPTYLGSTAEWTHSDSVDDICTSHALTRWIDSLAGDSFFAVMWTGNTHWPYFNSGSITETQNADPRKERYIKALKSSDAAIGDALAHLKSRGLLETTLVVILGDHGEAFGEHGRRSHGSDIYDEQTRIPLLLINPSFSRASWTSVGGIIDVGPTILHVLGQQVDGDPDGRSLFDPSRSTRTFLFAPNQEMVAGYREGDFKYIYHLARNRAQIFNLVADPDERINLASEGSREVIRRQLASWLRDQKQRASKERVVGPD